MEEGGEEIDGLRQGLDNVVLDFNPTKKKKKKFTGRLFCREEGEMRVEWKSGVRLSKSFS